MVQTVIKRRAAQVDRRSWPTGAPHWRCCSVSSA